MKGQCENIIIIGSGPSGCTAGIYAARANLRPVILSGFQTGGQLSKTTDVENYPGFLEVIQGPWLMEQMLKQAQKFGANVYQDEVEYVDLKSYPFVIKTVDKKLFHTKCVIICTGASAKWLGLKSESEYKGFGVSACAVCDGFFFRNKKVLVVGGGNVAIQEALHLTQYTKDVILMHRGYTFKAEKIMQEKLLNNKNIKIIWNSQLEEILGTENPKSVNKVKIKDLNNKTINYLDIDGIFIAIGYTPNSYLFRNYLTIDNEGYIVTNPNSTKTDIPGVFAAGDVQDKVFRQAITSAATGCMAALEAEKFLIEKVDI